MLTFAGEEYKLYFYLARNRRNVSGKPDTEYAGDGRFG
jgi:hypothetical protein